MDWTEDEGRDEMKNEAAGLVGSIREWVERAYNPGSWRCKQDCFRIHPCVTLPDTSVCDLVSIQHCRSVSPDSPDLFVVGLWAVAPAEVTDETINRALRQLQIFHAWYADLAESARCCGFRPDHRFEIRANVVGATIQPSPLTQVLSDWGRDLSFWTWHALGDAVELLPYYGGAPQVPESRRQLRELLSRLSWKEAPLVAAS